MVFEEDSLDGRLESDSDIFFLTVRRGPGFRNPQLNPVKKIMHISNAMSLNMSKTSL